jgi:hypothetical protein
MKRITVSLAALAVFASAALAEQPAKKTAPKKTAAVKAKPARKTPAPVTIPADAKEISPGLYRWVDPKGQAWTYRKTPFGIMRGPEQKAETPASVPTDWTATDAGDSVAFTGPSPFGPKHWTVKKTELSETEAAVWKRAQEAHNTASASAGK